MSGERYVDPYHTVWAQVAVGNRDQAFAALEQAFDEHSNWLPWVSVDPLMDELHSDPRYPAFLEKMGLGR